MSFPPLEDPEGQAPDGSPGGDGQDPKQGKGRTAPAAQPDPAARQDAAPAAPARAEADRQDGGTDPPKPSSAGTEPPAAELGNLDDDDLEELNEQIDLGDLDDLDELEDQDDPGDRSDHEDRSDRSDHGDPEDAPRGEPPVPAGIQTEQARAAGDEPIPMLTEVVQVPRYDSEDLPQSFAEVDWGDLAQRVRENVLERLLRRSDALLDAQLQNTLTPVLERAAETVAHELHDALNRMIRDIVARAVTEELTRLHAEIAKRNRSSRPT